MLLVLRVVVMSPEGDVVCYTSLQQAGCLVRLVLIQTGSSLDFADTDLAGQERVRYREV